LGATVLTGLTGNLSFPRQTSAATVNALSETATGAKSSQTLDQDVLSPKRKAAIVEYSRQLLIQSSVDVENWLHEDLFAQVGTKLDYFMLNGQGASIEPMGILEPPGVGSVPFGGTATWPTVLQSENALATANADQDMKPGWVTTPNVRKAWKSIAVALTGATTVSARPLWEKGGFNDGTSDGIVNDYRTTATNQVLNNGVIFGNWKELILGLFGTGIDILVNPYSRDTDGMIRISANGYLDVAIRLAASFCVSADPGYQ
jgi:HK97 family phage major capsid protein